MNKFISFRFFSFIILMTFCVLVAPPTIVCADSTTGDSTQIQYGTCIQGAIDTAGEIDKYTFVGDSGDVVILRMNRTSGSLNPYLELFAPDSGRLVTASPEPWPYYRAQINDLKLTVGGTYTLLVGDDNSNETGGYALSLQCANRPGNPQAMVYGDLVEDTVVSMTQMRAYQFVGDSGDVVILRMNRTSGGLNPYLELFAPGGGRLVTASQDYYRAYINDLKLTLGGTYTLLVGDDNSNETGGYALSLQSTNRPGNPRLIAYGGLVQDTVVSMTQMRAYQFVGDSGDVVILRMNRTSGGLNPYLELFGSDGGRVLTAVPELWPYDQAQINDLKLTKSGTYTLLVSDDNGNETGAYTLSLQDSIDIAPPAFDPEQIGTEEVPIDASIKGTFTKPIDPTTLNSTTFFVTSSKAGLIHGTINYAPGTTGLEFDPDSLFLPDDTITVTLTDGVKDLSGNKLKQTYVWQFVTGPGVYPGDANNDGVVNEVDVLPLGIFWSTTDLARDSLGISWVIKPVKQPWAQRAATYADANGDGVVDIEDLDAISANWGRIHPYPNPTLTPDELDSLTEHYPNMDAFKELYQGLKDKGSESGDKIREILETVINSNQTPDQFTLFQNYPNPFNPETEISYFLPQAVEMDLIIYNVLGEKVKTLVDRFETAGLKRVSWDGTDDRGKDVASGIYFYRIKAGEFSQLKKMLLMR